LVIPFTGPLARSLICERRWNRTQVFSGGSVVEPKIFFWSQKSELRLMLQPRIRIVLWDTLKIILFDSSKRNKIVKITKISSATMIFFYKISWSLWKMKGAVATIRNFGSGSGSTTLAGWMLVLTLCIVELVGYTSRHFLAEELHPTLCEIPAHIYCVFASNTIPPKQIISF
jgi:hypothetical protein